MTPEELNEALANGTLNEAAEKLEKERADAQARGDVKATATASNDLGVLYYLLAKYPEARAAMESARDGFTQVNDPVGQARSIGNLARLEERKGDKKVALAMYQQAADMFHAADDRDDEFATLRSLSQLYLKLGGWLQALATFDHALLIKPHRSWFDNFLHWLYQIPLKMLGFNAPQSA